MFWLPGERPVIQEGTEAGPVEAGPMEDKLRPPLRFKVPWNGFANACQDFPAS